MKKLFPTSLIFFFTFTLSVNVLQAQFAGGDGTAKNPYQISNVYQLQFMKDFLSSHFILINNIDASATSGWSGGEGFLPVGTQPTPFNGSLKGAGFKISGLTINRPVQNYVGLFGVNSGVVSDLGLEAGAITGAEYVGGLAGVNNYGEITNSYATGSVSSVGIGLDYAGAGGLVGWSNGAIINSYATGNVSSNENVGGLVGNNWSGVVHNSYATGNVSGSENVGGLGGYNNNGIITNSYATGNISGFSNTGGLIGCNTGTITRGYWNTTTTGQSTGAGCGTSLGTTGLGNSEFRNSVSFAGFDFTGVWDIREGVSYPFLRSNPQDPPPGITNPFAGGYGSPSNPYLIVNVIQLQLMKDHLSSHFILIKNIDASSIENFEPVGTGGNPFTGSLNGNGKVITGLRIDRPMFAGLFGFILADLNDTVIKNLGLEDIDIKSGDYAGGLIAFNIGGSIVNSYSTGSISGSNYIGGLVGDNNAGAIYNSYSTDSVSGNDWVGGLVGRNNSSITGSYATGSVSGSTYTGGLVGHNNSSITDSYAAGNVSGRIGIGGLAGGAGGNITNCYSNGNVHGDGSVGGLVGVTDKSGLSISSSYATGSITGGINVGGLVGNLYVGSITGSYATGSVSGNNGAGGLAGTNNFGGTITDSYWNMTTTGQGTGVGTGSSSGTTGLPDSQFRNQVSFTGFDFAEAWDIREGLSYPFLRSNPQDPPPGSNPIMGGHLPTEYALSQNYPNPFNPITKINYEIPVEGLTKIIVYDMSGREIATLVNEVMTPGYYTVEFNGVGLSSGVYFYRLAAGNSVASKKMVLVK